MRKNKFILFFFLRDDYLREGLVSEIKIMQKLKSPNIVALLDVMETSNNYYII
jgi:calcium-dependent protein kinase